MEKNDSPHPADEAGKRPAAETHECCGGCGHHHHGNGHDHEGHDHDHEHDHHHHHEPEHHAAAALAALDQRFFFYVRVVILLLWGGVLLYFFTSGRITHYLTGAGSFRVQALVAGLLLCLIGVFNAVISRKSAGATACADGCGHDHDPHDHAHAGDCGGHGDCGGCGHDHAHDHGHGTPDTWVSRTVSIVILCLPLTAAAIYTPDRYSDEFNRLKVAASSTFQAPANAPAAQAFAKKASAAAATPDAPATGSSDAPTAAAAAAAGPSSTGFTVQDLERLSGGRSPEGNIKLQLVEVFYMPAQTPDVRDVVASQTIEAIGQAIKDPAAPAGTTRLKLFRMQMTCCAADARPLAVPIEFDGPLPEYREMGWYKVTGKVEYRDENGTSTAVIKATKLDTEKPPRNQMLF